MSKKKSRQKTLRGVGGVSEPPDFSDGSPSARPNPNPEKSGGASGAPPSKVKLVTLSGLVIQRSLAPDPVVKPSRPPTNPPTARPSARPSQRATASFDTADAHDAWTTERLMSRSTPPPMPVTAVERDLTGSPSRSVLDREDSRRTTVLSLDPHGGKALDLVERSSSCEFRPEPVEEMEELYALGNFSDALRVAELILGRQPNNEQAQRCANNSRQRLEQLYSSKIGSLTLVPLVALRSSDLRWLGLDHRAGFVLSRIDGKVTLEELLEICGMPRLEVLKTVIELLNCGAVFLQ